MSAWAFHGAKTGETSDLFDADDGYYIARLDTLSAGGKTFDAVKAAVRERVARSRAVERTVPDAQALAQAARSSSLEAAAAAKGLTVTKTGLTTRGGAAGQFGSLGEAVGAAFALPAGTLSTPIRQDDGVFVMRVDARKPAERAAFEAFQRGSSAAPEIPATEDSITVSDSGGRVFTSNSFQLNP